MTALRLSPQSGKKGREEMNDVHIEGKAVELCRDI
jgi:hypothetical protein